MKDDIDSSYGFFVPLVVFLVVFVAMLLLFFGCCWWRNMIDKDKHDNDKQDKVWQEGYKNRHKDEIRMFEIGKK